MLDGGGSLLRMSLRSRAAGVVLAVSMGLMICSRRVALLGVSESFTVSVDLQVWECGCSKWELGALGRASGSVVGMPTLCTFVRRVLMLVSLYSMKSF